MSNHHFLTDNYHLTLEIDFLLKNLSMKNRFQPVNTDEILTKFVVLFYKYSASGYYAI
jgi:hypothetical protein